jgi:hypothetical protein
MAISSENNEPLMELIRGLGYSQEKIVSGKITIEFCLNHPVKIITEMDAWTNEKEIEEIGKFFKSFYLAKEIET